VCKLRPFCRILEKFQIFSENSAPIMVPQNGRNPTYCYQHPFSTLQQDPSAVLDYMLKVQIARQLCDY